MGLGWRRLHATRLLRWQFPAASEFVRHPNRNVGDIDLRLLDEIFPRRRLGLWRRVRRHCPAPLVLAWRRRASSADDPALLAPTWLSRLLRWIDQQHACVW